jgi:hypothetical protein
MPIGLPVIGGACGGDGGEANGNEQDGGGVGANSDGSSQSDNDDSGNGSDSSPSDELDPPENLTILLPDGGTVTGSVSDTGYAHVFVEYSADRYDEIFAFYDDWTSSDSRDWSGGDSYDESQGQTVRGAIWDSTASRIGISDCKAGGGAGEFDAVCVQITDEG